MINIVKISKMMNSQAVPFASPVISVIIGQAAGFCNVEDKELKQFETCRC
ncbi:hypothetical protein N836_01675 [Leptolyngbya sp. Heron Island J]|nr:hypothetical protein N836_01675 [Leptolyngbya sp. Heron Island J]